MSTLVLLAGRRDADRCDRDGRAPQNRSDEANAGAEISTPVLRSGSTAEGGRGRVRSQASAASRFHPLPFFHYTSQMLEALMDQMADSRALSDAEVRSAVETLIDEQASTQTKADFLTALARKGETTAEITAFARELRARSVQPPLDAETRSRDLLDVCGTGGDRLNTFNISTTVALVVASAGVTVAKHGNRAITSQAGSADVLEALGIPIDLAPEHAAQSLRDHHFAFFFAPKYHPAFKHIGPARKLCAERGQRTIFNFLGPLLNPAGPTAQLIGVPRPELCEPMARVLQSLGAKRGMVVSGSVETGASTPFTWLDEFSTLGPNTIAEFYQEKGFSSSVMSPGNFPLQPATLGDLSGGDPQTNAAIVHRLLRGEERGPRRDAVLLNTSAALFIAGRTGSLTEGWALAVNLIDSGKAYKKLASLAAQRY